MTSVYWVGKAILSAAGEVDTWKKDVIGLDMRFSRQIAISPAFVYEDRQFLEVRFSNGLEQILYFGNWRPTDSAIKAGRYATTLA